VASGFVYSGQAWLTVNPRPPVDPAPYITVNAGGPATFIAFVHWPIHDDATLYSVSISAYYSSAWHGVESASGSAAAFLNGSENRFGGNVGISSTATQVQAQVCATNGYGTTCSTVTLGTG